MKEKKDNKKLKKWIVNTLTATRVAGTFAMPFLFSCLSAPVFIGTIAAILFTDFLDGALARKWGVSTIFGSLLDMTADKAFGFAVIGVLSTMYPLMSIVLGMELLIPIINSKSASHGSDGKSSQLGRIKTAILGLSICALFITGLSPELIKSLELTKVDTIANDFNGMITKFFSFIINNKNTIETIATTAALTSETIVATDYTIKSIKQTKKSDKNYKISEYLKNKKYLEYIKKVLFDEKYYEETKNMSLFEKLTPPEENEKESVKKLTLKNDKN